MIDGSKSSSQGASKAPEVKADASINGVEVATCSTVGGATTYLNTLLRQMIAKQKANKSSKVTRHD